MGLRRRRLIALGCVVLTCLALTGCLRSGRIYTHTFRPLTTNFDRTPVGTVSAAGDVKHFSYQVDAVWDRNGLGEIGKKAGFSEIYYADLEVFSILGVWNRYYIHVYGRPADSAPPR